MIIFVRWISCMKREWILVNGHRSRDRAAAVTYYYMFLGFHTWDLFCLVTNAFKNHLFLFVPMTYYADFASQMRPGPKHPSPLTNIHKYAISKEASCSLTTSKQYSICGKTSEGQQCILTYFDYFYGGDTNLGGWEAPEGSSPPPRQIEHCFKVESTSALVNIRSSIDYWHPFLDLSSLEHAWTERTKMPVKNVHIFWNVYMLSPFA